MKAIVFDLDGTLLQFARDYREVVADAIREVEGEVEEGQIETYDGTFFDVFGECESDPYRRAFAAVGTDPDALVAALRDLEVAACRPPEGAREDLARLADEYALGVVTNGVREWQRHKLRAHDLDRYFEAVVASYEAGAHKPDPEPFRLAERRLSAEAYAMVGDADADVEGARNAGWTPRRYRGGGFGDLPEALDWK